MRVVRALVLGLVAVGAAACQQSKSANPLSPDVAGPIPGVSITAPKPLEPFAGQTVETTQQPLTFLIENGSTSGVRPLYMQFQLASDAGFQQVVHTADNIAVGTGGRTSYKLPQSLTNPGTYYWRARNADGANTGPYSSAASFVVAEPVVIETPAPVAPAGQINELAPTFVVRNGRVSGPAGPVAIYVELALVPDPAAIQAVLGGAYSGGVTTSIPTSTAAPYATTIYWRTYATNGAIESPRSAWVAFRTPNAPTGGGGGGTGGDGGTTGSIGAPRDIGINEAVALVEAYHNGIGANLGSRSTRDQRNAFLASAVAIIYYGHARWNPKGPDIGWCIKDAGGGRPQSDDVLVRCQTRDHWDIIGGSGADGYRFGADYKGILDRAQNVYPPPRSALPQ